MSELDNKGARQEVALTEQRIREMVQERNTINSHMNRRGGRGRGRGGSMGMMRSSGDDGFRGSGSNSVPIGGGEGRPSTAGSDVPKRSLLTAEDITIEERPRLAEKLDQQTLTRGSRLLGGLMGHLKKAKSEDDALKSTPLIQKKRAVHEVVEKRLNNFAENLKEARRLESIARKNEDLTRMKALRIDIQVQERKLLRLRLEEHYEPMMNFLRTETDPSLFYKPAKNSKLIDDMIEDTKTKIQGKLETLRGVFDEEELRKELGEKQIQWDAEHPLRELEFRTKIEKQEIATAKAEEEAQKTEDIDEDRQAAEEVQPKVEEE